MNRAVNVLLALTPLLPLLALLPGGRFLLPALAPLTLYPAFAARVRERDYAGAWGRGLAWALLLSAGVIALTVLHPGGAGIGGGIFYGEPYRQEMFGWVATGEAPENHPAVFIPQHLIHLVVFLALTWLSAGYLSLVMGAALVAYMSYFVGSFAAASTHPFVAVLAAWVPWSVIRVLSYVLLGSLFARPLLVRKVWPFSRLEYQLLLLAASGIALDILMKTLLAPRYGLFLRALVR